MNNLQKEGPKAERIFELLSKDEAMVIFAEAAKGIVATKNSMEKLGLTQKQYYVRLAHLVDAGLIEKSNDKYGQTAFGKVVYEQYFLGMKNLIRDRLTTLKIEDVLIKSDKFSKSEVAEFVSKLKQD